MNHYEAAREKYRLAGVDTEAVIEKMMKIPVSLHCWQGDDVKGFDQDGPLTGGIQTTGNYPGKARKMCIRDRLYCGYGTSCLCQSGRATEFLPGRRR